MKIQRFDSIWDAIEPTPEAAAHMKARSSLMMAISETVKGWGITQAMAARRLGLTQPRLNDLLSGRINKFSLDALMNLATSAGLKVKVEVKKSKEPGGLAQYVEPKGSGWAVRRGSSRSAVAVFRTQREAIVYARQSARGKTSSLFVRDKSGKLRLVGNQPSSAMA